MDTDSKRTALACLGSAMCNIPTNISDKKKTFSPCPVITLVSNVSLLVNSTIILKADHCPPESSYSSHKTLNISFQRS